MGETVGYSLSHIQLVYVAALLGVDTLIGIPDPFQGWFPEEIEEALTAARTSLEERGLLCQGSGELTVRGDLAALVQAYGLPEVSVTVTYTASGKPPAVRQLHARGSVLADLFPEGHSECHLIGRRPEELEELAAGMLGMGDQAGLDTPEGEIAEAALRKALQVAASDGPERAQAQLLEAGLPLETAGALALTLVHVTGNGAIAVVRHDQAEGLGLLEGANGLWLLHSFRRGGEDWVRLSSCGGGQAREAVGRLVSVVRSVTTG